MNLQKSQKNKRLGRQARKDAAHNNKIYAALENKEFTIYVFRAANAEMQKWIKKRGLLNVSVATNLNDAFSKIPMTWTGNKVIYLSPGKYPVETD